MLKSTYILLAKTPNFVLAQQNTFYERDEAIWQEDPLQQSLKIVFLTLSSLADPALRRLIWKVWRNLHYEQKAVSFWICLVLMICLDPRKNNSVQLEEECSHEQNAVSLWIYLAILCFESNFTGFRPLHWLFLATWSSFQMYTETVSGTHIGCRFSFCCIRNI